MTAAEFKKKWARYLTDINAAIVGLDKFQRASVSAVCAESVSPVIARFGQPATLQAFNQGLDAAWKSVRDEAVDSRVLSVRAALDSLPESTCDDSNIPAHDVMIALGILVCTLDTIIEDDSTRAARSACTGAVNYYSGYDSVLARGMKPRIIDPRNPPPPGPLELLQIQLQVRLVEDARMLSQSREEVVKQMRASATRLASELEKALPVYIERLGWNVRSPS
jgi:hypothetical protein